MLQNRLATSLQKAHLPNRMKSHQSKASVSFVCTKTTMLSFHQRCHQLNISYHILKSPCDYFACVIEPSVFVEKLISFEFQMS